MRQQSGHLREGTSFQAVQTCVQNAWAYGVPIHLLNEMIVMIRGEINKRENRDKCGMSWDDAG